MELRVKRLPINALMKPAVLEIGAKLYHFHEEI